MIFGDFFRRLFGFKEKKSTRGYAEAICPATGINADWAQNFQSEDADLFQNAYALTSRIRDCFKTNSMFVGYRDQVWAQVFGAEGILLRSNIKETEDRVVHSPDEKQFLQSHEERVNRVLEFHAKEQGREFIRQAFLHVSGQNGSRKATVKIGDPDIYANLLIERRWKEWQRAEYSDIRGTRNYHTQRQLRLIGAISDGDIFIRMVATPGINKFGFTLQLINSEWCDRFLNRTLSNGNVIRMGIEYEFSPWGLGKAVAYYFIKRQPRDWLYNSHGLLGFPASGNGPSQLHDRIDASEIIHYHRAVTAEGTRPAPWVASTIAKSRQLDQAMIAEVVAWREAASKIGFLYSDIVPAGGYEGVDINPADSLPTRSLAPGDIHPLAFGVKFQPNNPLHPNANVTEFNRAAKQDMCAGMPAANYSTLASDYAAINFSAGRLQRLDTNEINMQLQRFDIDYAEEPIFAKWLYMSLMTGAVPLPLSKYDKFNSKELQGRRWQGVDPVKDANASALEVANKFSSRTDECAMRGRDFEGVLFKLAEEEVLIKTFGLKTETTVETPGVMPVVDKEPVEPEPKKPSKKEELVLNERP